MADRVALYSRKVNVQLRSVTLSQVSGCAHALENAALARMPYGRKTAHAMTARQPSSAGYRQGPSASRRCVPPLPPTAT
jgi:hypothetical protein